MTGDVSNKALIVSDRCEIGLDSGPTPSVPEPALWAKNMHQPSSNTTAASQSLNNLRLNTHNINQRRMDQPAGSFLGGCLQTVCRSDPACLGYLSLFFFFCNTKMRTWVEQCAKTHWCLPYLVPTAPLSHTCCFEETSQKGSLCCIKVLGMCSSWEGLAEESWAMEYGRWACVLWQVTYPLWAPNFSSI